jgi:hypothetical protein
MSWIKNMFKSKKSADDQEVSREGEMLQKLESSITHCKEEILKAGDETEQLKKWAAEAIMEVFFVPNKLWYNEIAAFEEIKQLSENSAIDHKVVLKCNEVVDGYKEQIRLREAKVVLYTTLIDKYIQTKDKMEQLKKRSDNEKLAQQKIQALEKHSKRIDQLRNSPGNLNDHIEGSNQLELLKIEAKEVLEDFEISEEVKSTLEEINQQFNEGKYSQNANSAIEEIEKLTDKIKKQD